MRTYKHQKGFTAIGLIIVFLVLTATGFFLWNKIVVKATSEYPSLIVKKSEYPNLISKASQEPWSKMKTQALWNYNNINYVSSDPVDKKGDYIKNIIGSTSLLYIIDDANKTAYKDKIVQTLNEWPALLAQMDSEWQNSSNRWIQTVPPSSGFFNSVLALDIIHDDLTPEELTTHENNLDAVAEWYWAADRGWAMATYSPRAIWALYQGDTARLDTAKTDYRNAISNQLTSDGVFAEGPTYGDSRLGGPRTAKFGFMHAAEYTGVDPVYYSDSRLKNAYESMYTGGFAPFLETVTFGDADTNYIFPGRPPSAAYSAGRFSAESAKAASRLISQSSRIPGDLLSYAITKDPLPAPTVVNSKVWPDGVAAFLEKTISKEALFGALWNPAKNNGHQHKDVNAIYIAGYGEPLLLKSGYNGWGNDALGFSWTYIHDTAESSNTLKINGNDHVSKMGDKITENLLADSFNYASGLADTAIQGAGKHIRNFFFVHPQDGKNGYFITIDEASTGGGSGTANVALHPRSANVTTVSANQEYQWAVQKYKTTDTNLSIFLGTSPNSVELKDGVLAGTNNKSIIGKYLYSTYSTNSSGNKQIVTVLFPHDGSHAKPNMARVTGSNYSGASIDHGDSIVDFAVESSGGNTNVNGITFTGIASIYRQNNGNVTSYFVRKGTSFNDGKPVKQGFDAEAPVSLYMKGVQGKITSSGTNVTFHYPGITSVKIDGTTATPITSNAGLFMKVAVPGGTHDISFDLGPVPTPTPIPTPTPAPTPTPTPVPDTTAPTTSITSPANNSQVPRNSTVTIAANASDNVGVTKVEFYVNNVLKCTDTSSAYTCAWKVPARKNINYNITAKAYDAVGNIGTSVILVTSK